ncbi:MAG: UDP-N-acetylmuramoyl-L-alanyl-D-glutamate--2,6-diaminopimelate ligase [Gammaproteobacteria bacterium]|nr:UDP-N-acetylmuramoyl-L-alanyl-D-glutamate--2,6-diaminopimelate ligase [Gammaproteobacteria bacterium]
MSRAQPLSTLLQGIVEYDRADCLIESIVIDSRAVQVGALFLALPGEGVRQGIDFLAEVVAAGAVAIVRPEEVPLTSEQQSVLLNTDVVDLPVKQIRYMSGQLISRFYHYPSRQQTLIGVTGTDGKTSVSHFIAQALNTAQTPCGILGTLGATTVDQLHHDSVQQGSRTTVDVLQLQQTLAAWLHQGVKQVVMEVSSHGLQQQRIAGAEFDLAVLSNLGRDHLDYHHTLKAYREAKRRLFYRPELKGWVLNLDDEFGRELMRQRRSDVSVIAYGLSSKVQIKDYLWADQVQFDGSGVRFVLHWQGQAMPLSTALLGRFNVSNLLAAAASLLALGFGLDEIVRRLQGMKPVVGRMESFKAENRALVVVDYAHTPQALKAALKSLRLHTRGRLFCLFGCGGDRDVGKRPLMATVAEQLADQVVISDDNPRSEAPELIMQHILAGMKAPEKAHCEHDRGAAIQWVLQQSQADDVVLVAGKGHEDYQWVGSQRFSFSDRDAVQLGLQGEALV